MFKIRDEVAHRGRKEQENSNLRRALLSPGELSDIIAASKQGVPQERLQENFYLENDVLSKLGTAFSRFQAPARIDSTGEEEAADDFDALLTHGSDYMNTALDTLASHDGAKAASTTNGVSGHQATSKQIVQDAAMPADARRAIPQEEDDFDRLMSHGEDIAHEVKSQEPTAAKVDKPSDGRLPPEYIRRFLEQEKASG